MSEAKAGTKEKRMSDFWGLQITYCDTRNNVFLKLGRAAFKTKQERDENLSRIPKSKRKWSPYILDIQSKRGNEDDRMIDAATVESLMGKSTAALLRDARIEMKALEDVLLSDGVRCGAARKE